MGCNGRGIGNFFYSFRRACKKDIAIFHLMLFFIVGDFYVCEFFSINLIVLIDVFVWNKESIAILKICFGFTC